MRKTSTNLLVITITTAAIVTMATTTSLSAATPAFAKLNCTPIPTGGQTCSGGLSNEAIGIDGTGGFGRHTIQDFTAQVNINSGGSGLNDGTTVGGGGGREACVIGGCTNVGGLGQHLKGAGGNSGNVPP
jgi:hypothetical protein